MSLQDLCGERKEAEQDIDLRVDRKGAIWQITPSFVRRGTRIQTGRSNLKLLSLYLCLILLTLSIGCSVQLLSRVQHFATPWTKVLQAFLSITNSWSLLKLIDSSPSGQWCHPTNSSSVIPYFCPQSSPASGSFQMSQFFASGGQVLEFQLQHLSFNWIFRTDWL